MEGAAFGGRGTSAMLIPRPGLDTCPVEERGYYSAQERIGVPPWPARMFTDLGLPPRTPRIQSVW